MESQRRKTINDPIHGFITINSSLLLSILDHPSMQRLRRIRQLGMTNLVYPGAQHTRFQHALGAMHLMSLAVDTLRSKGHHITDAEKDAVEAAILMHDIGHGPFSHALEHSIVDSVEHEQISKVLMELINDEVGGELELCLNIFKNQYAKPFLYQLISSQLDTDRLDYLKRDSFYTGVIEGTIGSDRIIKMLDLHGGQLVVEAKGLYSTEKFLIARRLMYLQVYMHKAVISAEKMQIQILRRAKYLVRNGEEVYATPSLSFFLHNNVDLDAFGDREVVQQFLMLDDTDILASIKVWMSHSDRILAWLSTAFVNRELFRTLISHAPFPDGFDAELKAKVKAVYGVDDDEATYLVYGGQLSNSTYTHDSGNINILFSNGQVRDISEVSSVISAVSENDCGRRYYVCYPKNIDKMAADKLNRKIIL